jgi:ATP/maltotriose-dependent transcriptional regulator MalT
VLVERCLAAGYPAEGRRVLQSIAEANRLAFMGADVARLDGELILRESGNTDEAEQRFRAAIELARARSEKSLELRATMSLARLLARHGKRDEARRDLAAIFSWFTEGHDTRDLRAAKALLTELGA